MAGKAIFAGKRLFLRVLIWVSKGFFEDLARVVTRRETNFELLDIVTEKDDACGYLTSGKVDIVLLGKGRFDEWSQMWSDGLFENTPKFFAMLLTATPVSTATLIEASHVGIFDVVDLMMDKNVIGQRMLELFAQLHRDEPIQNNILQLRADEHELLQFIPDATDRRILRLISQGKFDKEISEELFLSVQTIRNRISDMLTQSGAKNRTHLAVLCTREQNQVA